MFSIAERVSGKLGSKIDPEKMAKTASGMHNLINSNSDKLNELKDVALQHGFDLTKEPEKPKAPQLSVTQKFVINDLTNSFIDNRRFPHDFGDYHDDIQRDVEILAGEVGDRHALPPDEHKQLVDILTNQEERRC